MSLPSAQPLTPPRAPQSAMPNRHLWQPVVSNFWLPLALLALLPIGMWLEQPEYGLGKTLSGMFGTADPYWVRIGVLLGINLSLAVSLQLINGVAGQFSLGHAGFMAVGAYLGGYAVLTHGGRENAQGEFLDWTHPFGVAAYFLAWGVLLVAVSAGLGLIFWLMRLLKRVHKILPPILGTLLALFVLLDIGGGIPTGVVTFKVLSFGFGLLPATQSVLEGPAVFMSGLLPEYAVKPLTMLIALVGAGGMAAVAGLIVGLPTLRLRGDYLAIATLGFAEIIRVVILNSQPLGRATGLSPPVYAAEADAELGISAAYILPWVFGVALVTILAVWRLQHSPRGRALQCLREDEIAAAAVGINVTSHKILAFVIGAFLAGSAGMLYASYDGYLNPESFNLAKSIEIVVFVTLGGLGSITGTLIATIVLTLALAALQTAGTWMPGVLPAFLPDDVRAALIAAAQKMNEYRLVIYAVLLVLLMLARSTAARTFMAQVFSKFFSPSKPRA